jgi:protein-S-isoprenylcysteine O-methyltransferase Ste14
MLPNERRTRSLGAAAFLVAEAVGCAAWWASLALNPDWRLAFRLDTAPDATLLQFLLPDLLLYIALPLAAAAGLLGGARWAWAALVAHAGAACYAALACWGLAITSGGQGWLGALLMSPSLVALPLIVIGLRPRVEIPQAISDEVLANEALADEDRGNEALVTPRPAALAPRWWNCVKTLLQTAIMWTVFLVLLPWLVYEIEASTPLADHRFAGDLARIAGVGLFTLAGTAAIFTGLWLSLRGHGTPLPSDTARLLVTDGPYALVRNPLALTGILQGAAVGVFLGSPLVIAYALLGALAWHLLARPWEEGDLARRFGDAYARYRAAVPLWVPRLRAWRDDGGR